jgi:UDP-3-O-[3-hydroxymyristoyl] glucosamine N-acyltransferase
MADGVNNKSFTPAELAGIVGGELVNDDNVSIKAVNSVAAAGSDEVTFAATDEMASKLASSDAGAAIVASKQDGFDRPQIIVGNVEEALIKALRSFAVELKVKRELHATAVVEKTASIGKNVSIGPGAYIGHDVTIGDSCIIGGGCRLGQGVSVGSNTRLDDNVVVYHNCRIGAGCIVQANSTIGSTGFGYSFINGRHELIPHNGGVIIEDCVEIGANCSVDRAKFGNTLIGAGTKVDNLVQIAHNVTIGKCCLLASQVGISGSCTLGDGVVFGGQVGMADHINVGDGVMCAAKSGIISDIPAGSKIAGSPVNEFKEQMRIYSIFRRLPDISRTLKRLTKKVESLESTTDNS